MSPTVHCCPIHLLNWCFVQISTETDEIDDIFTSPPVKPPRVIVLTTIALLATLAQVVSCAVDGTFKSMSRLWCQVFQKFPFLVQGIKGFSFLQLFILHAEFSDFTTPVAFGYLTQI